jgi:hypothetical protein
VPRRAPTTTAGFTECGFQALELERDRISLPLKNASQRASSITPSSRPRSVRRRSALSLAQLQPVFRARREHPIRLGHAAGDEIVDEHTEIRFVAPRRPAFVAAHSSAPR